MSGTAGATKASPTYPLETIAKLLMISPRRVQQLAAEGIIPREERGRYQLAPAVQGYIRYLQDRSLGREEDGSADWARARAQHMRAKAALADMELARVRGEQVAVEDVAAVVTAEYASVRSRLLAVAPRLSIRLAHETDAARVEAMIRDEVSSALTELSDAPAVATLAAERSGDIIRKDEDADPIEE